MSASFFMLQMLLCVLLIPIFLTLLLGNAEANVIYLETPAGVGYSYSADAAYYQGVDDKMTGTGMFIYFILGVSGF